MDDQLSVFLLNVPILVQAFAVRKRRRIDYGEIELSATLERVKQERQAESEKAASILGAEIRFFNASDYPLRLTDELMDAMVAEFREVLRLNKDRPIARNFLGQALHDKGFVDDAIAEYQQVLLLNPGHAYVVQMLRAIAHHARREQRFFRNRNVAGSRRDDCDGSLPVLLRVARQNDRPCQGAVLRSANFLLHRSKLFFVRASREDVSFVPGQLRENRRQVCRRLALAENHLRHPDTQGAMVVYLGESQVFKRQMPQARDRVALRASGARNERVLIGWSPRARALQWGASST